MPEAMHGSKPEGCEPEALQCRPSLFLSDSRSPGGTAWKEQACLSRSLSYEVSAVAILGRLGRRRSASCIRASSRPAGASSVMPNGIARP